MIKAVFMYGLPWIKAKVFFKEFDTDVNGEIWFLIDTGAGKTAVHRGDRQNLEIPVESLRGRPSTIKFEGQGVGGKNPYRLTPAVLVFEGDSPDEFYYYEIDIAVTTRRREGSNLPSLLGRDVLHNWKMEYDPQGEKIEFQVINAGVSLE